MKINNYIDHTFLKRDALNKEVDKVIEEAIEYKFKGLCLNPTWITYAKDRLRENNILLVVVIGFPFGQFTTETKVAEAKDAIKKGADELDFIVNVSKVHEKDEIYLRNELKKIRKATKKKTIKLILETGLLNKKEIEFITRLGVEEGFDYIKTSTAVNTTGANIEDIKTIKKIVNSKAKIKASGGVRTLEDAEKFIKLGVDRIGTSNGVDIMKGLKGTKEY